VDEGQISIYSIIKSVIQGGKIHEKRSTRLEIEIKYHRNDLNKITQERLVFNTKLF